ncbi:MAG: hypothetical protein Q9185_002042 [Variospora sp. 1 TL-2023]
MLRPPSDRIFSGNMIRKVQHMHDEFEALGGGASDDIFQTRASPFEGDLPLNVAINLEEASDVAANNSILQHQLRSLLPIKQGVSFVST